MSIHSSPEVDSPLTLAQWAIELDFDLTGAEHMRRDEELARALVADPDLGNILRLYSWEPPALSLGYQQSLDSIDTRACERAGIDIVRRPTGGRAVLHIEELTYAVVMHEPRSSGIYRSHNRIVEALLASLRHLGPEQSELALTGREGGKPIREAYSPGALTNMACFMSTARHEVTYNGRKVIGSAQRRFGDVVLQHGSILLSKEHLRLPEFLNLSPEARTEMRQALVDQTATLSDVFRRPIGIEEAANSIATDFLTHICTED